MTIASDAHYRSIALGWTNHAQIGTDVVQIFARPRDGAWSIVSSVGVDPGSSQTASWDTALPVCYYDLAVRYIESGVVKTGYEGSDPDAWTGATVAGSKQTLTTSCAAFSISTCTYDVSGGVGIVTLVAASSQIGAPIEWQKSTNGGSTWTSIGFSTSSYAFNYNVTVGETDSVLLFRVRPYRASSTPVTGAFSGYSGVYCGIRIGVPVPYFQSYADDGAYGNVRSGTGQKIQLFIGWSRSYADEKIDVVEFQWVSSGPHSGVYYSSGVLTFGSPATQDVTSQPDGFLPLARYCLPGVNAYLDEFSYNVAWKVRAGRLVDGAYQWGAYATITAAGSAFTWGPSQQSGTRGSVSGRDFPVTITVPSVEYQPDVSGPPYYPWQFILFDSPQSRALGYVMGLKIKTPGTTTKTMTAPTQWSGAINQTDFKQLAYYTPDSFDSRTNGSTYGTTYSYWATL